MKNLATIVFLTLFSMVCNVVAGQSPINLHLQPELDPKSSRPFINHSRNSAGQGLVVEESSVVISIPTDDEFYIGKHRVKRAEIAPQVDKLLRELSPEKRVPYLKAAREVKYGTLLSIRDELLSLGYEHIALVADKNQGHKFNPNSGVSEKAASEGPALKTRGDEKLLVASVATTKKGSIRIKIGETWVPLNGLAKKVRGLLNGRVFKGMIIEAPGAIHYGSIVQVMDELKSGGAEEIGLGLRNAHGRGLKSPRPR
jgi:biopolymer transport protein ExbD